MQDKSNKPVKLPIIYGISITVFVVALITYWFRYADRNIVFLYYHDMGPLIPSTAPFSFVTSSRYWMAGLVANGAVMLLYLAANAFLHLVNRMYKPSCWHSVWFYPAVLLVILIPAITMTTRNAPALSLVHAIKVTLITLSGLALALQPGTLVGQHPFEIVFLTADGLALSLILIGAAAIERIQGWLDRGAHHFIIWIIIMILSGGIILLLMSGVRYWLKRPPIAVMTLFLAGLCAAYPGMSILHHLVFTDGYFYITDSDNFFSRNILLQAGIWIAVWFVCSGISKLRNSLATRKHAV